MSPLSVRFLTRSSCHLCDAARPIVARAARRVGASVEDVDIDQDEELLIKYDLRIPVLLGPEGEVVAEGIIDDPRELMRTLRSLLGDGR